MPTSIPVALIMIIFIIVVPLATAGQRPVDSIQDVTGQLTASSGFETYLNQLEEISQTFLNKDRFDLSKASLPAVKIKQPGLAGKKLLAFTGGYASYNFLYRSNIDTPYTESNIAQHQLITDFGVLVAGWVPLRVTSYARKSNSFLFKDIVDVQVQFDASAFNQRLETEVLQKFTDHAESLKDSITGQLLELKKIQVSGIGQWLNGPGVRQKLVEANEILKVDEIVYDKLMPDSINESKTDSLRNIARAFIDRYQALRTKYDSLNRKTDSLRNIYDASLQRMKSFQQLVSNYSYSGAYGRKELLRKAEAAGFDRKKLPGNFNWWSGIKSFGVGRNTINTSELTARNVSLTGVVFEYSSWYYLYVAAGVIDYRFRDFSINRFNKLPQNLYLARVGLGTPERNFFILSAFHGKKQLYSSSVSNNRATAIEVKGLTAEVKWQLFENSYLLAEAGQSFSPNLQLLPAQVKSRWSISDKASKALSVKLYSYFPATSSRLEGRFKFTGANYQSFNSFQTNSEVNSWYVKADQSFFKKRIRIQGSLAKNEFSNPFINLNYKSNTVFKSINIRMNIRKIPVLSIGYMPTSQLTMVDGMLSESRFQTLNATASHFYRIGHAQAMTNIVYTKFFNQGQDSGFIYFNSDNLFAGQSFVFKNFQVSLNISNSRNADYSHTVLEENANFKLSATASLGGGVKVNRLNKDALRLGAEVNGSLQVFKRDVLSFQFERSYLPGNSFRLVSNIIGNISYTKQFR